MTEDDEVHEDYFTELLQQCDQILILLQYEHEVHEQQLIHQTDLTDEILQLVY